MDPRHFPQSLSGGLSAGDKSSWNVPGASPSAIMNKTVSPRTLSNPADIHASNGQASACRGQTEQLRPDGSSLGEMDFRKCLHSPLPLTAERIAASFHAPRILPSEDPGRVPVGQANEHDECSETVTPDDDVWHAFLTREYLQNDDVCSTATALHRQLGLAFLFSDCLPPTQLPLELAAGFRYFIPGSRTLAHEWTQFFDVAPSRFIEMVPAEVKVAYQATLEASNYEKTRSFKKYLLGNEDSYPKASDYPGKSQVKPSDLGDHSVLRAGGPASSSGINTPHSNLYSKTLLSSELPSRKRKFLEEPDKVALDKITKPQEQLPADSDHPFKRAKLLTQALVHAAEPLHSMNARQNLWSMDPPVILPSTTSAVPPTQISNLQNALPGPQHARSHLGAIMANFAAGGKLIPVTATTAAQQKAPQHHVKTLPLPAVGPPAPQPVQTVLGAQQPSFAGQAPPAISQPVPVYVGVAHAPPHGGNQSTVLPRAYVSKWTNPHPNAAPASMIAQGGGNRKLAWNAERRRIFTQVEGFSPAQLPRGANSPFATEMFSRTPQSIDPRLCPFPTSMEENLTYMTGAATMNREMCSRTKKRWTATECVYYVVQAHDLQTERAYERTRLQHQFNACAQNFERHHPNHQPTSSLRNCSTESGLTGENTVLHDYYLYAMGDGVARHPNGRAAQMLTRVIRHVRQVTQDRNVRLSEAAAYAARHNITVPAPIVMTNNLAVEDQPPQGLIAAARTAYIHKFGRTA